MIFKGILLLKYLETVQLDENLIIDRIIKDKLVFIRKILTVSSLFAS